MASTDIIDRCCGRTRVNVCSACGRRFHLEHPGYEKYAPKTPPPAQMPEPSDGVYPGEEKLPPGIAREELREFKAYRAGLWSGFILSLAVTVLFRLGVWLASL